MIERALWKDLVESGFRPGEGDSLNDFLIRMVEQPCGKPFFIIDEWDIIIREGRDAKEAQEAYLSLLRNWFQNSSFTPKVVAAAFMTGILPIKKVGLELAVSGFDESSMVDLLEFSEFTGFTEAEVKTRCDREKADFGEIKAWYDGYDVPSGVSVYNPYSVRKALKTGKCAPYWNRTACVGSLESYLTMDFEGLKQAARRLIAGEPVTVNVDSFQNDFETFACADDVLTLLIHLGYLMYHKAKKRCGFQMQK